MEIVELEAEIRKKTGKGDAKRIRKSGKVPGVVYGGKENLHIMINPSALKSALSGPFRKNTILKLKFSSDSLQEKTVILKDYQVHPITDKILHVDFLEVREDRKLTIEVPVKLVGTPEGVKKGGVLQWNIRKLKIRCYPRDLVPEITIDISPLSIGSSLHIGDITLPEGLEVVMDKTLPVVTITEVVEEKAAEEVPAEEMKKEEAITEEKPAPEEGKETEEEK